jgi:hypothetical protein
MAAADEASHLPVDRAHDLRPGHALGARWRAHGHRQVRRPRYHAASLFSTMLTPALASCP